MLRIKMKMNINISYDMNMRIITTNRTILELFYDDYMDFENKTIKTYY